MARVRCLKGRLDGCRSRPQAVEEAPSADVRERLGELYVDDTVDLDLDALATRRNFAVR